MPCCDYGAGRADGLVSASTGLLEGVSGRTPVGLTYGFGCFVDGRFTGRSPTPLGSILSTVPFLLLGGLVTCISQALFASATGVREGLYFTGCPPVRTTS